MSPALRFDAFDTRLRIREARVHIPRILDAFYGIDPSDRSDDEALCFLVVTGLLTAREFHASLDLADPVRDPHALRHCRVSFGRHRVSPAEL